MTKGKYGIKLQNGVEIYESKLTIAIAKAQARKSLPIAIAYLCEEGCMGHPLKDHERVEVSNIFPEFQFSH